MQPRIAIVSTIRSPGGPALRSFVRYHRRIGFDRFYLFFDPDDEGAAEVERLPGVEVVVVDEAYRRQLRRHPYARRYAPLLFETGARVTSPDALTSLQLCNAATGLDLARRDGVRWLLHVDVDELFWPGEIGAAEHFARLDAISAGSARYINHEALPEKPEHDDYFAEMTLFKRNPSDVSEKAAAVTADFWKARGGYFLAYANGKAAVRVVEGATPATAHGFQLPRLPLGRCQLSTPCILHYPYTSFARYWAKHQRLGDFAGDVLLGQRWNPPRFLLDARDRVRDGRVEEARRCYLETVMLKDRRRIGRMERLGMLMRIEGPQRLLLAMGDQDDPRPDSPIPNQAAES